MGCFPVLGLVTPCFSLSFSLDFDVFPPLPLLGPLRTPMKSNVGRGSSDTIAWMDQHNRRVTLHTQHNTKMYTVEPCNKRRRGISRIAIKSPGSFYTLSYTHTNTLLLSFNSPRDSLWQRWAAGDINESRIHVYWSQIHVDMCTKHPDNPTCLQRCPQ